MMVVARLASPGRNLRVQANLRVHRGQPEAAEGSAGQCAQKELLVIQIQNSSVRIMMGSLIVNEKVSLQHTHVQSVAPRATAA